MDASIRDNRSLALYNELKNNWKRDRYIEVCTFEERRSSGWWKMGNWRLKGMRGNAVHGMCAVCRKDGVTSCEVREQEIGGINWKKFVSSLPIRKSELEG
jgi:hypothetical protein